MRVEIKPGMYDSLVGKPFKDSRGQPIGEVERIDYRFDESEGTLVAEATVRIDCESDEMRLPPGSYLKMGLPSGAANSFKTTPFD